MGDGTQSLAQNNPALLDFNFAPASSSFTLALSVSALVSSFETGFGAPSTSALASARPTSFTSRTALMTAIFLSGEPNQDHVKCGLGFGGRSPLLPRGPGATTGAADGNPAPAADTPHADSRLLHQVRRSQGPSIAQLFKLICKCLPCYLSVSSGHPRPRMMSSLPASRRFNFVVFVLAPSPSTGSKARRIGFIPPALARAIHSIFPGDGPSLLEPEAPAPTEAGVLSNRASWLAGAGTHQQPCSEHFQRWQVRQHLQVRCLERLTVQGSRNFTFGFSNSDWKVFKTFAAAENIALPRDHSQLAG